MNRRDFTRTALLGAVGAGMLTACGDDSGSGSDDSSSDADGGPNVITGPSIRWRLASSFSRSLDTIYGAAEVMAQRVADLTEGKFDIRCYPGGELIPSLEVLSNVQTGTVQMGHAASYYFIGKNPALAFDATVPFGLTARQYNAWLYHGGGMDLMRDLFSDFNVINFPGGNTGMQMGGWFRVAVESLSDLNGLKMRIPGLGGQVMNEMGVNTQVYPSGEIYPALERGAIDAAEWVGPYDDEKLGFHEVAPYYYYPGWWEPGPALTFYVNQDAYDKLPATYQHALAVAASEANVNMLASYDHKNPAALERLLEQGTELRKFPEDVMSKAQDVTQQLLEDEAAGNAQYRKIYESYKAARSDSYRWFGTAERAYADFAFPTNT
ncbi:ABC transporter substrate-binding protein [Longibacter salinarum]|uniref:ABC transporter substrate-binding protein n=1 Tax=Longibacter salinarum TaxID=1850348 RepID=A0A2A8CYR9_9BACT|nr:TRAP transporter substrate-binding protein [Longibacter salinarum]PEN13796.1 ABC transporter substrate-binding protein [Longibacter salinarum]